MRKILINFAHPAQGRSHINKRLRSAVEDLEGITIHDLYRNYPDFMIDVKHEQELCEAHDVIVFQHPFYWYSAPSIIKEWMDLVLEHGWAYGSMGKALKDKIFFQTLSAGGDQETYQRDGYNKFTLKELTSPYQATANLCGMIWLPPFVVAGVHRGLPEEKVIEYAQEYRHLIMALRDGQLDIDKAKKMEHLRQRP